MQELTDNMKMAMIQLMMSDDPVNHELFKALEYSMQIEALNHFIDNCIEKLPIRILPDLWVTNMPFGYKLISFRHPEPFDYDNIDHGLFRCDGNIIINREMSLFVSDIAFNSQKIKRYFVLYLKNFTEWSQ